MSTENAEGTPSAAPEPQDNSPLFADAYAELVGDASHVPDAEPDVVSPDKEATPAASEGESTTAEHTGEPPADAATPTPDQNVDTDPFEGAGPAKYRVGGEERTFDGIQVLKDNSGVIDPEKMGDVLHRLSERDHLYEASQQRHKELTDLQAEHANATRWKLDDGRTVEGREGAQARDLAYATTRAELDAHKWLVSELLAKPTEYLVQDENGKFFLNPDKAELLQERLDNKLIRLGHAVQAHYAQRPAANAAPAAAAYTPPDPAQVADALISHTGVKGFEAADKAYVAQIAKAYVRPATKADVASDPVNARLGEPYAPPELLGLVRDRAALLARSAKQVEAATTVAKENEARMAAANRGKGGKAPATVIAPLKPAVKTRMETQDERWERENGAAANVLRQSVMQPT